MPRPDRDMSVSAAQVVTIHRRVFGFWVSYFNGGFTLTLCAAAAPVCGQETCQRRQQDEGFGDVVRQDRKPGRRQKASSVPGGAVLTAKYLHFHRRY